MSETKKGTSVKKGASNASSKTVAKTAEKPSEVKAKVAPLKKAETIQTKPAAAKTTTVAKTTATAKTAVKAVAPAKGKATAVAKTKTVAKTNEEKKITVTFEVYLHNEAASLKEVYVVGNIAELGNWDASKGLALKEKDGKFIGSIKIAPFTVVEYKITNALNWVGVEKGMWGEELTNHVFHASIDHTEVMGVSNWAMQ